MDMAGLSVDESGNVTGAKDAIKALAKERLPGQNCDRPDINGGSNNSDKKPDPGQKLAELRQRWGIGTA